jgi:hypothetical protein
MARTYDPPEETFLKGPWQQKNSGSGTLTRVRSVWLDGITEPIAQEIRTDWERTDLWIEASRFTGTYMRRLKALASQSTPLGENSAEGRTEPPSV